MSVWLILSLVVGFQALFFWFVLFGSWTMLRSFIRSRLDPGETVEFESRASKIVGTTIVSAFSIRHGMFVVSNLRVLFATFVIPPFWRSLTKIRFSEVASASRIDQFPAGIRFRVGNRTISIRPYRGWLHAYTQHDPATTAVAASIIEKNWKRAT